jgi:hypothetical protein
MDVRNGNDVSKDSPDGFPFLDWRLAQNAEDDRQEAVQLSLQAIQLISVYNLGQGEQCRPVLTLFI